MIPGPLKLAQMYPAARFWSISTIIIAFCIICQSTTSHAQINAVRTDMPVTVDGVLTEPVWDTCETITGFTQRELSEGDPATENTEVRILFDESNLYIGVICHDNDPDGILHRDMNWDSGFSGDDHITVVLDTYNDRRNGFMFSVNPNGAQYDATFNGGSEFEISKKSVNSSWDGIWYASSRITDTGWSCEIMLPFKTLRFPSRENQTWGINFMRRIRRKNEEVLWRGWLRDDGIRQLSRAGTLFIPYHLEKNYQVDVKPYTLYGIESEHDGENDDVFKYGLDARIGITSNSTLTMTTKTDFAQIESDREVINLTRFSITYAEKRDFFLESAETFESSHYGTQLFYSRRIGITADRKQLPILGGAKFTQKSGSFRLGALTMQTEADHGYPTTNYSVVRIKKDLFSQSSIGFLSTSLMDGDHHDNQLYSVDFNFATDSFRNRNIEFQTYLAGTVTDGQSNHSTAGKLYLAYPNDFTESFLLYHVIDRNFNPEIGYVQRTGIKHYIIHNRINPRPNIPYVKQFRIQPLDFNYITSVDGRPLTRIFETHPLDIILNSGDALLFQIDNFYEYLYNDFTIFDDVTIRRGEHRWVYYQMNYSSDTKRPVHYTATARWGGFYNGSRDSYSTSMTLKRSRFYSISADMSYNSITIGNRSIQTREYGGKIAIDFSTRLSSSVFVQWNNETRETNTNVRLHFIPRIGSDFYLVYNHLFDEEEDFATLRKTALLKVDYNYRF